VAVVRNLIERLHGTDIKLWEWAARFVSNTCYCKKYWIISVHVFLRDDQIWAISVQQNIPLPGVGYRNWLGSRFIIYAYYSRICNLQICYHSRKSCGGK